MCCHMHYLAGKSSQLYQYYSPSCGVQVHQTVPCLCLMTMFYLSYLRFHKQFILNFQRLDLKTCWLRTWQFWKIGAECFLISLVRRYRALSRKEYPYHKTFFLALLFAISFNSILVKHCQNSVNQMSNIWRIQSFFL